MFAMFAKQNEKQMKDNWDSNQYATVAGLQKRINEELLGQLPFAETDQVLDAGCGVGNLTFQVAEKVKKGRVLGIDSSESMIKKCDENRKNHNIQNVRCITKNMTAIDFANEFHVVFSSSVFHWVKETDQALGALYRSLKPGGSLGIQFPLLNQKHPFIVTTQQAIRNLKMEKFYEDWEFPWYVPALEEFRSRFNRYGFQKTKVYKENPAIDFQDAEKLFKSFNAAGLHLFTKRLPEARQVSFKKEVFAEIEKLRKNNRLIVRFERIYAFGYHKTV
jgi:trans-aconitate 2-methyltransferase